jgi:hypothetical protein
VKGDLAAAAYGSPFLRPRAAAATVGDAPDEIGISERYFEGIGLADEISRHGDAWICGEWAFMVVGRGLR